MVTDSVRASPVRPKTTIVAINKLTRIDVIVDPSSSTPDRPTYKRAD
jgi:hypothetical protein